MIFKNLKNDIKVFMQKYGYAMPEKHTLGLSGKLSLKAKRLGEDNWTNYGIVSQKKVTDAFANYIVDALQTTDGQMNTFRWHAFGESTAAESAADTLLTAETTQVRVIGTSTEGASSYIWSSVATMTFQAACTVGEHAVFNSSGLSTGTMMDRSMFDGLPMSSGDQMQYTYQLSVVSSG